MRFSASTALVLALGFLFFGCVQGSLPSQCLGMSGERLTNCVYVRAVIGQNPFNCYSIDRIDVRKTCISDASNTAMKKKIEGMAQSERDSLYMSTTAEALPAAPTGQPAAPSGAGQALPGEIPADTGASNETPSLDQQVYSHAVDANNVQLCEQIGDYSTMRSCISQVARQMKVMAICDTLSTQDNIDLCRMYSQGGDVKG